MKNYNPPPASLTGHYYNPARVGEGLSIYEIPEAGEISVITFMHGDELGLTWYYSQRQKAPLPGEDRFSLQLMTREVVNGELFSRGSMWFDFLPDNTIGVQIVVSSPEIIHRPTASFVKLL